MQNNLVVQFETQMKSNIKQIVFASSNLWQEHLMYMLSNVDQEWINILSAFVNRRHPKRVLRLSSWCMELGVKEPKIHNGLNAIPFMISETNENPARITHDAWDISDLIQGSEFIVTYPLLQQISAMKARYGLQHEESFWDSFISSSIMDNLYFSKHMGDFEFKNFITSSLQFLLLGNTEIDMSYIKDKQSDVLCELYKNIYTLIVNLENRYVEIADRLGSELEKEKNFKIALARSERMLPERLRDAELKIKQKQQNALTSYNPEDSKERSKFENV